MRTDRLIIYPTIALYHQITQYSATKLRASPSNDYQQKTSTTLATDMPALIDKPEHESGNHRNN